MFFMKEEVLRIIEAAVKGAGIKTAAVQLEYPENPEHGDFSTNIALAHAKELKMSPKALAEKLVMELEKRLPDIVEAVEIAGPGFINFRLKNQAVAEAAIRPRVAVKRLPGKVMVEYTDPNPFKAFHIGHLMSNAIGESISRLIEHSGSDVIRACYQGDVGLHVAKTIWSILSNTLTKDLSFAKDFSLEKKVNVLGLAYAEGNAAYDEGHAGIKTEIEAINKKIFDKSDKKIMDIYETGKHWSLDYFDAIYKRLGTEFKEFFFESEVGDEGLEIVNEFLKKDVFEKSDGAIVFKGEEFGLHTRVFVNSQGLPTYETKEIGLNIEKFRKYPDLTGSLIVTGNDINEYFKVLKKVLSLIAPEVAEKTSHLSHGMMRFASGKMSSRTGNVVTAESLIGELKEMVVDRMKGREFSAAEADEIAEQVAIAAIKYTVLRSSVGNDIIFDSVASVSFEGDSGPYLQYSAVRANSVLEKAKGMKIPEKIQLPEKVGLLERLLVRFDDIALRAAREYAPQQVAGYLIELAGAFNGFYAGNTIADTAEPLSPYRIALTKAFLATMIEGLCLLGIKVPKRM